MYSGQNSSYRMILASVWEEDKEEGRTVCSLNMLAFDAKRCSNSAGGD